jgi:catechol 2,3-dioxygenase-like lactoylglutathione lyase family enzyme
MPAQLDHLILMVNDLHASLDFYTRILGFIAAGERPPFTVVRVTPDFVIQLAPFGTSGGEHLAFAMSRAELEATFARVREAGIPYGDAFDQVGNMRGPGVADGARGATTSLYFFDPSRHLIEVACYDLP